MKKGIGRTFVAVLVLALACVSALASGKGDRISVQETFQLNGTTIERGSYDVSFDAEAGELSIKKNGKVIAKSKARAEQSESKSRDTTFTTKTDNGSRVLSSVRFAGDRQTILVGAAGGAVTGSAQ
jgi:hypothetical protein